MKHGSCRAFDIAFKWTTHFVSSSWLVWTCLDVQSESALGLWRVPSIHVLYRRGCLVCLSVLLCYTNNDWYQQRTFTETVGLATSPVLTYHPAGMSRWPKTLWASISTSSLNTQFSVESSVVFSIDDISQSYFPGFATKDPFSGHIATHAGLLLSGYGYAAITLAPTKDSSVHTLPSAWMSTPVA